MTPSRRPGGLTAMAVINFILFAWGLLEMTSVITAAAAKQNYPDGPTPDLDPESMEYRLASLAVEPGIADMSTDDLTVLALLAGIVSLLLLISGIGYLLQRRVMGYVLGCVYAAGSIGTKMFSFFYISPDFHIGGVLVLIYPLLTLFLLNTTFRDDFPR